MAAEAARLDDRAKTEKLKQVSDGLPEWGMPWGISWGMGAKLADGAGGFQSAAESAGCLTGQTQQQEHTHIRQVSGVLLYSVGWPGGGRVPV